MQYLSEYLPNLGLDCFEIKEQLLLPITKYTYKDIFNNIFIYTYIYIDLYIHTSIHTATKVNKKIEPFIVNQVQIFYLLNIRSKLIFIITILHIMKTMLRCHSKKGKSKIAMSSKNYCY